MTEGLVKWVIRVTAYHESFAFLGGRLPVYFVSGLLVEAFGQALNVDS